ncbi:MAG TPA: biopolymer transporter ExbD [Burkholderiaceae bacterium]|nr:biopolymer transporter ExbD [Burkholderiaceae bacterium]
MSHGPFTDTDDEMLSEINMIPLIDVMLVLLIVFIITVPVMKHAVNIDLPRASNDKELVKPETVRLSVDADGTYFWNEQKLADDNELQGRLAAAAAQNPPPDLHIRGDRNVRYERVAQAMAAAQQAGVKKIGFITEPAR